MRLTRSFDPCFPPPASCLLGFQSIHQPRERRALADVRRAADPGHRTLEAQAVPRVDERSVLPKVEVPAVGVHRQALLLDPLDELVVVIFALRPANDLT